MSDDLESQRRALRPDSGMLVARGNGNEALQGELRAFADRPDCASFARSLEWMTNNHGKYFTASTGAPQPTAGIIAEGERLGLWRKHAEKEYWTHTHLTWKWIRTAIALDDERGRAEPERAKGSQGS